MTTVNFRIPEDLLQAVDALLEGKNKTRSSFIIEAVEAYYREWLKLEAERELVNLYPEDQSLTEEEQDWMDADLSTPSE